MIRLRPTYDRLAEIIEMPYPEAEKATKDLESGEYGLTRQIGFGLNFLGIVRKVIKFRVHQAMFRAAVAVCRDGEGALQNEAYREPYAGVPFKYEKTVDGFRLVSKTIDKSGEPITFEVGRGQK